jgi:hypothetical protein
MFSTKAVNVPVPMTAPLPLSAAGAYVCPCALAFHNKKPPHSTTTPSTCLVTRIIVPPEQPMVCRTGIGRQSPIRVASGNGGRQVRYLDSRTLKIAAES